MAESTDSDDRLIQAVAAGEEAAFRALYRRHTPRLRALLGRLLGYHAADTDDALQETWIRAVAGLGSFRGQSQLSSWLGGIGVNVSWELIRRRRPRVMTELNHDPPLRALALVERMDLEDALSRLSDVHRLVVVLHDVEGYTHEEIARQLGIAEGTSKSHLFRARRVLRAMLESYERIDG